MGPDRRELALVTGASAGIGLEIARVLAEEGFDLALVARRGDALESEYGASVTVHAADLLAEDAAVDLEDALSLAGLGVDMLVNNAGVLEAGAFREIGLEQHRRVVELNIGVLTDLTHRFLGPMVARGHGRILNVASTAAFQPVPSLALYAATKAFVLSLTESLSEELKGTGVSVTALCPGLTRTQMVDQAQEGSSIARLLPDFMVSDARAVAREGVDACLAGRVIAVPGRPNWLSAHMVRLYPRWVVRTVGGLVGRRTL